MRNEVPMVKALIRPLSMALLLGALLLAACPAAVSAQAVQDVPRTHWAYEAVMKLVERGYLALEDGRFRGDQPVDRFTLAEVVAKILNEIETGAVGPRSREDVELLRRLVTEFEAELVDIYAGIEQNQARAERNERELLVLKAQMTQFIDQVQADLDQFDRALREGLAEQEAKRQAELQAQAMALRAEMGALESSVRQALAESGIALGDLSESLAADSARLEALQSEVRELSQELEVVRSGLEEALREFLSELNAHSEALAAQQLALDEQRRADSDLLKGLEAAVERLSAMQGRLDAVERQVVAMQSQIGLSEEQLRALSDRLMSELESQYQHSFLFAGTVADELKALREEFASYRQRTERELQGARNAQIFGIIGAILGLISLAN